MVDEGPARDLNAPSPTGTVSSSDSDDGRQDSEGDAYQGSNEGKESQEMNRIV